MAALISIEVIGADKLQLQLDETAGRVEDATPAMAGVYQSFLLLEEKRFANEGPGWAPLNSATLANKERLGYPSTILVETEAMKKSLTTLGARGAVFEADEDGVTMATEVDTNWRGHGPTAIAAFHQFGSSRGLPKRTVIDVNPATLLEWAGLIGAWIADGAEGEATASLSVDAGPGGL